MGDLLQIGSNWLTEQLQKHASRQVVYVRSAEQATVRATIGRTLLKLDDGYGGVRLEWTDRDFLIQAVDLVLGSATITPKRGDRIRETLGVTTYVYEVMAPGSEPPWRWSDVYRQLLRIHTKQIGTEEL